MHLAAGVFSAQDGEILSCRIEMDSFVHKPESMGRTGSKEFHQEMRASKEVASSGGRKALVSEFMYHHCSECFFMCLDGPCNQFCTARQCEFLRDSQSSYKGFKQVVGDNGSGRCGICSAHVAVRGMLDCCGHE